MWRGRMNVTLYGPSIRDTEILQKFYNTIQTDLDFEVVFTGPREHKNLPKNLRYIRATVKPTQCAMISVWNAEGETIMLVADDQSFTPYALDEAYKLYKAENNYKTIVSLQMLEHGKDIMHRYVNYEIQMPVQDSIMSKEFFLELGGYDNRYIRMDFDFDLYMRAYLAGAKFLFTKEGSVNETGQDFPVKENTTIGDRKVRGGMWGDTPVRLDHKVLSFENKPDVRAINQGNGYGKWPDIK